MISPSSSCPTKRPTHPRLAGLNADQAFTLDRACALCIYGVSRVVRKYFSGIFNIMKKKKKLDPQKIDVAQSVRQLRHDLGEISQHALALRLGVQTAMISHWETRVQRVSHRNLWKMAQFASAPLCWKFLEADGMSRSDLVAMLAKRAGGRK